MFVQTTRCKRGRNTYLTYLVRESFRTPKGPRSRTICNITALPAHTRTLIAESLRGQSFVSLESLELSEAQSFGGLAVLRQAWDDFGLDELLRPIHSRRHAGLLKAMIFGRILFPSAKLALADHARGTLLGAACGLDQARETFDEDDLYAAMDELNGRWVAMEKQLYAQSFAEGVSLVLYDLTSVYFEGDGPAGISRYGYSRDHRADRPQVLLAVATDSRGVPSVAKHPPGASGGARPKPENQGHPRAQRPQCRPRKTGAAAAVHPAASLGAGLIVASAVPQKVRQSTVSAPIEGKSG